MTIRIGADSVFASVQSDFEMSHIWNITYINVTWKFADVHV